MLLMLSLSWNSWLNTTFSPLGRHLECLIILVSGSISLSLSLFLFTMKWIGLALVIVGQACRTVAMFSARHNFSHHIADYKAKDHVLVTHGIYRWVYWDIGRNTGDDANLSSIMRHPSYFGFYWWAVGVQFLLMNPICLVLFIYWLQRFFAERITYEEYTLLRFFGNDWTVYKAKTPTWMPLIP